MLWGKSTVIHKKRENNGEFKRKVNTDKRKVWKLISDVAHYNMFAPNIDNVTIVSGEGEGMVRTCSHGKETWAETCTLWRKEIGYAYYVHTNEPDYPYPFKHLNGFRGVEEIDKATSNIVMRFEFQYNRKFQNKSLKPLYRVLSAYVVLDLRWL